MMIGEYGDDNKKRGRQNRRSMQTALKSRIAKAMVKVVGRETSPILPLTSSSPSSWERSSSKIPCKKYFTPYFLEEVVEVAFVKGNAFKATFRVNAHNRLEVYCTIKGVPIDILINGLQAQNRAIEGDVVAVALDPVINWTKLKGANANASLNTIPDNDSCSSSGRSEGIHVLPQEISDANSSTEHDEVN